MARPLENIIRQTIRDNGPISVETYWNLCLAHPVHGYYITRDPFGLSGDFITAPEISQLFGEMIGIWIGEKWQELKCPSSFHLVECGPGRGTLMSDILRIGKIIPHLMDAVHIHLVETSPSLRDYQRKVLSDYHIIWHDCLSTLPDDAPLIIIGNEFLDALPIQQFVLKNGEWFERMIGLGTHDDLIGGLCPTPSCPAYIPTGHETEAVFEYSRSREHFILDISARIKHQGGASLMIDYGHDRSGFGDTLQAVKNHQYADVLKDCGDVDLTSHVDFGRLKSIVEQQNLSVRIQTQSDFLGRMGIHLRAAQLIRKSETIESGLTRLMHPDDMGVLFKVMEIK